MIVFSDMDGTLLTSDKQMSDATWAMLDELARRGVEFVPCTGRPLSGIFEPILAHPAVHYAVCANIDLYTGFIYKMLGVPETLFTPLFAVARMAGWSAHRMEELFCAHRIIRPAYRPVIEPLEYKPLADR